MQLNPRILANLPLISVKTPANLLVKLAELGVRGAIGAPGPGNTLGRGSYTPDHPATGHVIGTMMRL